MEQTLVDTAGNRGGVMEKVVERDTVSPGSPVVSLSKVGDIIKESIDLWITGEQDTRAKIVIQGSNGTSFNQDVTLENGDLKILSIISKLQCGNVTYIAKVTLTDKASNTSRESTSTVTTSDCPSCGTVSSNSPIRDPNSYITARFGVSAGYGSGSTFHYGIDYGNVPVGTPVYPMMAGKVLFVQNNIYQDQVSYPDYNDIRNYGNYIDIDHGNGIKSRYAHLKPNSITVAAGQIIPATLPIGGLGNTGNSTGAHLHFEIRVNGKAQDPEIFLNNKASFQSTNSNLSLEQQN